MSAATMRGCFLTGTDTGVGKTRVSAALLHWLGTQGLRGAGYKPVAAGTEVIDGERVNEDVRALRHASSVALTDAVISACQFEVACAPHIAAALEGRTIERAVLLQGARTLAARADRLVVEGVGGFCVPLGPDFDSADLAADLALPVVLVVGLRLGCINHALLSAEAIRSRGLRLAGWVANTVDPAMLQLTENLNSLHHELRRRHQAPCIGVVPRLADPDPAAVAAYLDPAALRALFNLS
jgi:dethiobiotin synthetase